MSEGGKDRWLRRSGRGGLQPRQPQQLLTDSAWKLSFVGQETLLASQSERKSGG